MSNSGSKPVSYSRKDVSLAHETDVNMILNTVISMFVDFLSGECAKIEGGTASFDVQY